MSLRYPSWIAVHLLGEKQGRRAQRVLSETVMYGSTAGPYNTIGGAAMTTYQMTLVQMPEVALVFADERLLGWVETADMEEFLQAWPNVTETTLGLRRADTCPIRFEEKTPRT